LRAAVFALGLGSFAWPAANAHAQLAPRVEQSKDARKDGAALLDAYMRALEHHRLAPPAAERVEELSEALERAQRAIIDGDKGDARARLFEIVEGPRFRDFQSLEAFHSAELMLTSALTEAHALVTAQRVVDRLLARGPEQAAFGPAYRRAVDIALARGDLAASASHLASFSKASLPEDAKNELSYIEGRAAYDANAFEDARVKLSSVSKRSRFYANAQYLLGAIAAKQKRYDEAERRFCAITEAGKNDAFSFYVDDRFFPVRDLAYLGLGRVAHETGRANDAFYYYFQVPNDSDKLAAAMFEAAWASYEGGDHAAALDSLDQLDARYPRSAFSAEAAVLRGYVHLSRCEFSAAERHLTRFEKQFGPVLTEIDTTLASSSRKQSLYRDLVARNESVQRLRLADDDSSPTPDSLLLALIEADPNLYRLHAEIRTLDAEIAESGSVPRELSAMSARLRAGDTPKAHADEATFVDPVAELSTQLARANLAVDALARDIQALSTAGAKRLELATLREQQRKLDSQVAKAERMYRDALRAAAPSEHVVPVATELGALLQDDERYVNAMRAHALSVRAQLVDAADLLGEKTLREVRERLAKELRRARIGRIDAVMGSKRQVELQIESLAAGRFPPELADVLRMQSLLRDDEEYWPFEGEDWPDEFLEIYPDQEAQDEP
jgi:TolA-binding protein